MKSVLIIVSLIICLSFNYIKNRTLFNITGVFLLFWGICATFASFSFYGLDELSYTTAGLIIIAMFLFTVVGLAFPSFNKRELYLENLKQKEYRGKEEKDIVLSNSLLVIALNASAYLFSIPYLIKAINIIRNQGFEILRTYAFAGSSQYASSTVLTVFQYIISPLFIATLIITAIDFSLKKRAIIGIIMSAIGVLLYTVLFGGRYMLFQAILVFIMAYYLTSYRSFTSFFKRNKKIVLIVIAAVIGMLIITSERSSGGFLRSIYIYFCGSFKFLDVLIEDSSFTGLHLFGAATFGFIYDFVLTLMVIFFKVSPYYGANYQITQITGSVRVIGDGIRYNSLGTMYTAFVADFGVWGSIIGVFVFAIIVSYFQKNFSRKQSYFSFAMYLFGLYSVINAVLAYSFLRFSTIVLFIFLIIFTRKVQIKARSGKLVFRD